MNTMTQHSVVRARIDTATKERAADVLADMGLSISDAIRLLLIRVADERRFYRLKSSRQTRQRGKLLRNWRSAKAKSSTPWLK